MSIRLYEYMKNKYETIKPIRGRAIDTRPWNDRRRDAELIVQTTRVMDGVTVYGAKLYGTTVFEVDPKGTLTFRCDDWVTRTTTDFLDRVLRELRLGWACRRFNNIWVQFRQDTVGELQWVRIPRSDTIDIEYNKETDKYDMPEQTVVKRTTDTIKMKELRAKAKGFVQYYRSLLKLSDGVVTAQFKADNIVQDGGVHNHIWYRVALTLDGFDEPQRINTSRYFRMSSMGDDVHDALFHAITEGKEENYAPLLTWFANTADMVGEGQLEQVTFSNGEVGNEVTYAVNVQQIDRMVTQILKEIGEAYVYTEVQVTEPTKDDRKGY